MTLKINENEIRHIFSGVTGIILALKTPRKYVHKLLETVFTRLV